ncbi:MAG: ATP synthase F1 subunit epsilon [Clostridiales bacterium]|nr:ATP synthase F1 subunit epsilon [Clostridiales bacterium]
MGNSVKLEIMTPSKMFYRGDVDLVIVTTSEGDEGFMFGHSWACKLLEVGELWIQEKGAGKDDFRVAAVAGGFIDVQDSIIIYTDAVEWSEDIDMDRVLSEKAKAEDWLTQHKEDGNTNEVTKAKLAILKAITRSNVAAGGIRRKR